MSQINPQEVIEIQKKDWNRVAPAWEKWDHLLDRNMAFLNYRLVGEARLRAGDKVLDLGSGTGYPALLIAQAVGKEGRVTGLDLAEEMIAAAQRKMEALRLSNITFQTADITSLPFDPSSYHAVTSRFCLMFLPDIPKVLSEIQRVLKPGGYFTAAVWSAPDKNPYLRIPMDVIKKYMTLQPPEPNQPGLFRLAKPGDLLEIAEKAGLEGITDEEMKGTFPFESADEYYQSMMDLAAPLQPLFAKLSAEQMNEAEKEIKRAANEYKTEGEVSLPIAIRIVVARKPA